MQLLPPVHTLDPDLGIRTPPRTVLFFPPTVNDVLTPPIFHFIFFRVLRFLSPRCIARPIVSSLVRLPKFCDLRFCASLPILNIAPLPHPCLRWLQLVFFGASLERMRISSMACSGFPVLQAFFVFPIRFLRRRLSWFLLFQFLRMVGR